MALPTLTPEAVDAGEFPRLHCAECDWDWTMHQPAAPSIIRITSHEFLIPEDER